MPLKKAPAATTVLQSLVMRQQHPGQRQRKIIVLAGLMIATLLGGLGSRLVYLQLLHGDQWRQRAEDNRIRLIARQPERGRILDRKGRMLVGSKLSHSVFLWPVAKKNPTEWNATLDKLAQILNKPKADLQKRLDQLGLDSLERVRVARNVTPAQITAIAEGGQVMQGVEVDAETTRIYPYGKVGAHILGYTGDLSEAEYEKLKSKGYRINDVNGKFGVEAALEDQLRGEWGGQQIEVDAAGKVIKILGEKPTHMGQELQLTIDIDLQKAAEAALGDRKGAIVALDPNNGAVLAMASWPTFDPNLFSKEKITQAEWDALNKLPNPFVNRAIQAFPPASTFKIITTTAAIESGKWPADTVLNTFPFYEIGGTRFGEWNKAGFGPLNFADAITLSSDTFFYQIARRIDGDPFSSWMRRFGIGEKTGIELLDEAAGVLPDEAWKQKEIGEGWLLGDSINMSIGQGFVTTSPLQMAAAYAVPANGGFRVKPHLLKTNEAAKNWRENLNLKPETIAIMQRGLRGVVTHGTGQEALDVGYLPAIAGKSGTSEDLGDGSDTWFAAYAPFDKPEVVVVAFAERSGESGGKVGGPMVRQVMEAFFALKTKDAATKPNP